MMLFSAYLRTATRKSYNITNMLPKSYGGNSDKSNGTTNIDPLCMHVKFEALFSAFYPPERVCGLRVSLFRKRNGPTSKSALCFVLLTSLHQFTVLHVCPGHVMILSSYNEFMAASTQHEPLIGGTMSWGILGSMTSVPRGFVLKTILYYGDQGINKVLKSEVTLSN